MKLDQKTLGYISVFENQTGASVKDCFISKGTLVFIVNNGNMGKAIGRKGINIKILINKFKKPIRVIEFSEDSLQFVKNLIFPIKVDVENKGDKLVILAGDKKLKGKLFGRDKSNLKEMQIIIKRYFNIQVDIE